MILHFIGHSLSCTLTSHVYLIATREVIDSNGNIHVIRRNTQTELVITLVLFPLMVSKRPSSRLSGNHQDPLQVLLVALHVVVVAPRELLQDAMHHLS